ncbi:MAG: MazG nucleotide pyrophosphohydrolase domain-containing protein [Nanoarchaeota archaeon]
MTDTEHIGIEGKIIGERIGLTIDDILNKLTQEVGEFNDAIQKYRGRFCKQKSENLDHIKEELGDVYFNLICIASIIGLNPNDFPKYAEETLQKFKEREDLYKRNLSA